MAKNYVEIEGNLVKDPILKYTAGGVALCNFSIAVNSYKKTESGYEKNGVSFFDVQSWDQLATDMGAKSGETETSTNVPDMYDEPEDGFVDDIPGEEEHANANEELDIF